jgi:hypothetical protein
MLAIVSILVAVACFPFPDAVAESARQSVTFYGGPATRQFVSEIIQGHFNVDGTMLGLAYDRQLADLGAGFDLEAEVQVTHFFMNPSYSTVAVGVGVRYDTSRWTGQASSFAFYTGPSYADDATRDNDHSQRLLEYVSVEFALENISNSQWDGVVRMFHRSGAFGLYQNNTDIGSMLGIGIRRRF